MHQRSGTGLTRKPPTRCCFTDHVQNDSLRYANGDVPKPPFRRGRECRRQALFLKLTALFLSVSSSPRMRFIDAR
jgi:hypothetical protein